jgi:hypothetical protein
MGEIEAIPLPHSGKYHYEITQGKEYSIESGDFEVKDGEQVRFNIELERLINMPALGWYAGDMHNHRPKNDMPLLMKSEGVYFAQIAEIHYYTRDQWSELIKEGRTFSSPMFLDDGRCLLSTIEEEWLNCINYFNVKEVSPDKKDGTISTIKIAQTLTNAGAWLDLDRPTWWDAPLLVALSKVNSMGLICNHFARETVIADGNLSWSYMQDQNEMPGAKGYADWNFLAFSHFLNCGLRILPSAGSASGVLNNPIGGNRMYVFCGKKFDCDSFWKSYSQGKVIVTNGPILIPEVNGQKPGYIFRSSNGKAVALKISGQIVSQMPISHLEVIKDGKIISNIEYNQLTKSSIWSEVTFKESGWLILRVLVKCQPTQYYACITAPYYVEIGDKPRRISRISVLFFLDWLDKRQRYFKSTGPFVVEHGSSDRLKWKWNDNEHQQAEEYYEALLRLTNTE